MEDLNEDDKKRFIALQDEGKRLASLGQLENSLALFKEAETICATKKVLSRIARLENILKDLDEDEDAGTDAMVELCPGFQIYHEIHNSLYPYQKEAVRWMWNLYKNKKGGILGDDMGLGKTFQVIAFLSGIFDAELIKSVLIIMPVSLIPNWKREFAKWSPGIKVYEFHGTSKKEREQNLKRVQRRDGVLITSYGMILSNFDIMVNLEGSNFVWDYLILDEGHKIKNPTKTTKAVHEIPSRQRLVLTGTPIQNNLRELWALYDFAHHGTLLGSQKTFKLQYETPIQRSLEKDCSAGERLLGSRIADNLRALIQPYFMRRTKSEVLQAKKDDVNVVNELGDKMSDLRLTAKKNEFIVWTFLSDTQHELYTSFLESDAVKQILVTTRSPLVELTVLKKICDHPRLLSHKACVQLGLDGKISEELLSEMAADETANSASINNVGDETLIQESGKVKLTIKLLENLRENGHRTLVFSLSRKILDMIHRILSNRGWKVLRIDGTVSKMQERDRRIQLFQNDKSLSVFLLTTQVGGVGITLTAADRVIIYDPSWNPATDAQAVDRVFRIGQDKDVVVYRLITCGTVEEKIYRRQIFKDSIMKRTTGASTDPHRYFSNQQLRELFTINDIHYSETQVQLAELHSKERQSYQSLDTHIEFLKKLDIFGISDHDLLFTKEMVDNTEDIDPTIGSDQYIQKRVEMAQQLVQTEASIVAEGLQLTGSYANKFTLPVPASSKKTIPDYYQQPHFPSDFDTGKEKSEKLEMSPNIHIKAQLDYSPEQAELLGRQKDMEKGDSRKVRKSSIYEFEYDNKPTAELLGQPEDMEKGDSRKVRNSSIYEFEYDNEPTENTSSSHQIDSPLSIEAESSYPAKSSESVEPMAKTDESFDNQVTLAQDVDAPCVPKNDVHMTEGVRPQESPIVDSPAKDNAKAMPHWNPSMTMTGLAKENITFDLSDEELSPLPKRNKRRSCAARRSALVVSESDTSREMYSSHDASEVIVPESDEDSSCEDSSNRKMSEVHSEDARHSFADSLVLSSSDVEDDEKVDGINSSGDIRVRAVKGDQSDTKPIVFFSPKRNYIPPEIYSSLERTNKSSPKRLTPLRLLELEASVNKSPFQRAMRKSVEINWLEKDKENHSAELSLDDTLDSPIATCARRKPRRLGSFESDNDSINHSPSQKDALLELKLHDNDVEFNGNDSCEQTDGQSDVGEESLEENHESFKSEGSTESDVEKSSGGDSSDGESNAVKSLSSSQVLEISNAESESENHSGSDDSFSSKDISKSISNEPVDSDYHDESLYDSISD